MHTIRNLWQNSLTSFILVKVKLFMMHLFDVYKANKKAGGSRSDFLLKAAQIPGIYVPSLYEVTYKEDGTIESFHPTCEGVPEKIEKQLIIDMDKDYNNLEAPVVPHIKATQDRVTLEIQRGCIRGCRFCQAGMIYRPTRERDVENLKKAARTMLQKHRTRGNFLKFFKFQ